MSAIDFSECQQCLCRAARAEARRMTRLFDEKLRPHDLTISQFTLLATLVLAGPQLVTRLATHLDVDRTTLTRNLGVAEAQGLVQTRPGEDGRERLVEATPIGRARAEKAFLAWRAAQQTAQSGT